MRPGAGKERIDGYFHRDLIPSIGRRIKRLLNTWMAEGRTEGIKEGIKEGEAKAVYSLLQKGRISLEDASEELNIPVTEIEKKMAELGYKIPKTV